MKDAVITLRVPLSTRKRIEEMAHQEGRSISQQAERLIDQAMTGGPPAYGVTRTRGVRSLAGVLRGGRVPTLAEFREARTLLSRSLSRHCRPDAEPGRGHTRPRLALD